MPRARTASIVVFACALLAPAGLAQEPEDVPVTIKELDVEDAIREFSSFQQRLGTFREEIAGGRAVAQETAQILEELRSTATAENGFNEKQILAAIAGYVDGVIGKQVELVDFLESQRYRISYYAKKMAASVRPEEIAILFGTEAQNDRAIALRVQSMDDAQQAIREYIDDMPEEWFNRETFQPTRSMPQEQRQKLDQRLYAYQQEKDALELAKKRLQLVRSVARNAGGDPGVDPDIDANLLVGQMFGALDRVRLQMSIDLMYLEQMLGGYSRSARTQEILDAFQSLVEMQGTLEGPSPELGGVLDWLQDSSARRLTLSASGLSRPGLQIPRSSELLREAYAGAKSN